MDLHRASLRCNKCGSNLVPWSEALRGFSEFKIQDTAFDVHALCPSSFEMNIYASFTNLQYKHSKLGTSQPASVIYARSWAKNGFLALGIYKQQPPESKQTKQ